MIKFFLLTILLLSVHLQEGEGDFEFPEEIQRYKRDQTACGDAEYNEDSCFTVKLETKDAQCCLLKVTNSEGTSESCSMIGGSLEGLEGKNELSNPFIKELAGYQLYAQNTDTRHIQEYKCKNNKELTIKYGYDTYTDEDISILKSEKNCLNYFYSYMENGIYENEAISEENCFTADLLQSSKDAGIECGYFEYQFKYYDGSSNSISSCYLYDKNSKKLAPETIANFKALATILSSMEGKQYKEFKIYYKNKDGEKFSFNPDTGEIETSASDFFKYKFLFLNLILFGLGLF